MMVEPGLDTSVHFTARPASSCTASTGWSVLARPCTTPPPVVQTGGGGQALPEQCAAATTTNHTTFICHSHYNLLLLLTSDCSQHAASIL